jgi:hypothetical protein
MHDHLVAVTSELVLAQNDSVANWVGAIGQWAGVFATVAVAVVIYRWQRQHDEVERRDREKTQAALVTMEVDYSCHDERTMHVVITNHSDQQVRWPRIERISNAQPEVRWAERARLVDEEGLQYCVRPEDVLLPGKSEYVPYQHFSDGQPVDLGVEFFASGDERLIKRDVQVSDVTITFDMFGIRWWRTGNGDPVRVEPGETRPAGFAVARLLRRVARRDRR